APDHALHQRVDHPAAAHRGLALSRAHFERGRAGPPQDHAVHALRHDSAECRAVAGHCHLAREEHADRRRAAAGVPPRLGVSRADGVDAHDRHHAHHVGRRMYGGASTHIPLKVNTGGVIPVIFASSILAFPATIISMFRPQPGGWADRLVANLAIGMPLYNLLYVSGIIFFAYFYTAIIFNPDDVAENMRKYGGFVPGIRPGKRTAEYIDTILTR